MPIAIISNGNDQSKRVTRRSSFLNCPHPPTYPSASKCTCYTTYLSFYLHHPSIHLLMYLLSTPPIHQSDIQKIQKCHSPDVAECCGGAAVWRTRWRERPPPPLAPTAGPRRGPLPPLPDKGPQRRVRNRENGAGPLAPSLGRQRYDVFLFHRLGNGSLGTRWRFDGKLQKN